MKIRVKNTVQTPRGLRFRIVEADPVRAAKLCAAFHGEPGDWLVIEHDDSGFIKGMVVELEDAMAPSFTTDRMLELVEILEPAAKVVERPGITPPAKTEPSPDELNEAIDTLRAEDFDKHGRPSKQALAALLDRPVSDGLLDAALKVAKPKGKKATKNPSIQEA